MRSLRANSRSGGMRSPGCNSPVSIMVRMWLTTRMVMCVSDFGMAWSPCGPPLGSIVSLIPRFTVPYATFVVRSNKRVGEFSCCRCILVVGPRLRHDFCSRPGGQPVSTGAMALIHDDRLFPPDPATRTIARRLYAEVRDLPLICPHGHTQASWFVNDDPFPDPAKLFVQPDHYIFRMLYSQGITLEDLEIGA